MAMGIGPVKGAIGYPSPSLVKVFKFLESYALQIVLILKLQIVMVRHF